MAFDWCASGDHNNCRRSYERFYFEPRSKKNPSGLVVTEDVVHCQCSKRGCPCYVKADERAKPKKRKK